MNTSSNLDGFNYRGLLCDLYFLPNISYFALMAKHEFLLLEQHEHYQKQSFRTRALIRGPHKVETLNLPILNGNSKQLIRDVRLDYSQNWQAKTWRTIVTAYAKAPYFEYFAPYFEEVILKKNIFLWDLNYELLTICLKLMKNKTKIQLTEIYQKNPTNAVFDARDLIDAKNQTDISNIFCPFVYTQNFGSDFVPNLSIIDLLFCKGTESNMILQKSLVN